MRPDYVPIDLNVRTPTGFNRSRIRLIKMKTSIGIMDRFLEVPFKMGKNKKGNKNTLPKIEMPRGGEGRGGTLTMLEISYKNS